MKSKIITDNDVVPTFLNWLCTKPASDILKLTKNMSNNDVWSLAMLAVSMAGKRAQEIEWYSMEQVCIDFVEGVNKIRDN